MSNFLLLHGAASTGWMWHRVAAELHDAGHIMATPDLPCSDPDADLFTYLEVARAAAEQFGDEPFSLVVQSMSGLMAPTLAEQLPVERIVFLAAMIPRPKETGFEWWEVTGQRDAQREYLQALGFSQDDALNSQVVFIHDFDEPLKAESIHHVPDQHSGPMQAPNPFEAWPSVPTHVIAARDDRLFPLAFMHRQAQDASG